MTVWLSPLALPTPKWTRPKPGSLVNAQEFAARAMKGLHDSKEIRFFGSKLPFGEKEEKFQRRKGKKKEYISTALLKCNLKETSGVK